MESAAWNISTIRIGRAESVSHRFLLLIEREKVCGILMSRSTAHWSMVRSPEHLLWPTSALSLSCNTSCVTSLEETNWQLSTPHYELRYSSSLCVAVSRCSSSHGATPRNS